MVNLIFNYLLKSSLCLILLMAAYRILIANRTNFSWMRFYLLVSMALSLILPWIIIPMEWSAQFIPSDALPNGLFMQAKQTATTVATQHPDLIPADSGLSVPDMILFTAFMVYAIGVIYKFHLFARNLIKMHGFIKKSAKIKEENYWIVCLYSEIPPFSFFNYIFINNGYKNLSPDELQMIKNHEMVHFNQYHTLDILFVEWVGILFWFNPIVHYLKRSLKEIHEYIVDERIAGHGENKKAYAQLLLTLASDTKVFDLAASFAGDHIKRRILMIAKPRTSSQHKLMFLVLLPLTAILLVSFSCLKNPKADPKTQHEVTGGELNLKKYCGVYSPTKRGIDFGLKPMKILLKHNALFIEAKTNPGDKAVELHIETDSTFSYTDHSARSIAFDLDHKKEVTGCTVVELETKGQTHYLVLKGEYSKRKPGTSEE